MCVSSARFCRHIQLTGCGAAVLEAGLEERAFFVQLASLNLGASAGGFEMFIVDISSRLVITPWFKEQVKENASRARLCDARHTSVRRTNTQAALMCFFLLQVYLACLYTIRIPEPSTRHEPICPETMNP